MPVKKTKVLVLGFGAYTPDYTKQPKHLTFMHKNPFIFDAFLCSILIYIKGNDMKNQRNKISFMQVVKMFADEAKAEAWLERAIWGKKKHCPRCKSDNITPRPNRKPMPYHCASCRKYFSIRTNTVMQESKLPLQKWAIAIYLMATNLKGISSTHLANELGIRQPSAWHMLHRIRTAFDVSNMQFDGVVEADETFIGGKASNISKRKRSTMKDQAYEKSIIIGLKERDSNKVIAQTIPTTGARAIQPVVKANVEPYSIIVSDENPAL